MRPATARSHTRLTLLHYCTPQQGSPCCYRVRSSTAWCLFALNPLVKTIP